MPGPGSLRRIWLLAAVSVCWTAAWAANGTAPPDTSVSAALRSLAARAGVAFVGRVTKIEHQGGVVLVHFAVEQTVLGQTRASYTLREWAGLWPPGEYRYVAGERVLIFLHPAAASGLSTPVDGMEGVLPVIVQGASSPELVDMRRVETRVVRAVGAPLPGAASGAMLLGDVLSTVRTWRQSPGPAPKPLPLPEPYRPAATGGPEPLPIVRGGVANRMVRAVPAMESVQ